MTQIRDYTVISDDLRHCAGEWMFKGNSALLAFRDGEPCSAEDLLKEIEAAIRNCMSKPKLASENLPRLRMIESIARRAIQLARMQARLLSIVQDAIYFGASEAEVLKWAQEAHRASLAGAMSVGQATEPPTAIAG